MKFYVLRLVNWLPNAVRQTNQPKQCKWRPLVFVARNYSVRWLSARRGRDLKNGSLSRERLL
jgi:hypothetical protein